MADDIKIKVGVQSDVKAGMDRVVRDLDKSMQGRGFAEVFGKAIRGDLSGALEDIADRMKIGMGSVAGKAIIWGGGIATAIMAGWKAGMKIDEMLGISDKIAEVWAGGLTQKLRAASENATIKAMREARLDIAKEADELEKFNKKKRELQDEGAAIEGGAEAVAVIEARKLGELQAALLETGLSVEEVHKRTIALMEQENRVKKLLVDQSKEDEQLQKEMAARYDARLKRDYEAGVAAEADQKARDQNKIEVEREFARMGAEDAAKRKEAEIKAIDEGLKKDEQRVGARRAELQKLVDLGGGADERIAVASNLGSWQDQRRQQRQQEREEARQRREIERAERVRDTRGARLTPRQEALLKAQAEKEAGIQAAKDLAALDAAWKKKQQEGAEAMIKLEKEVKALLQLK